MNRSLLDAYRQGNESAAEQLVKEHIGLVRRVVGRMALQLPPSVDREDLEVVGILGLLNAAKSKGVDVPGTLAISGYDNTPQAALPLIGLTSIDQRGKELGHLAAQTLLSRISGRTAAEHRLIDPILVQRTSS